ncbi:nitroreductase family protein [Vibrio rotiferianus]|uniref:nitroreductase family protein n=1 Tax=Vibrio rotiferianus TaxID=190895 RepID=UPI00406A3485
MNDVIEQLLNRRSIRVFSDQPVNDGDLTMILKAAQQAPTSVNGQQISLIVTRDKKTIEKIADIAHGQPQVRGASVFVTAVIDFNRASIAMKDSDKDMVISKSAEGIMVGAIDAGIAINALQTAAVSLGYGTTVIGGIRANPTELVKLLGLPKNTYPIIGSTIGVPEKDVVTDVKPRVPLYSFAMFDQYDNDAVAKGVEEYDETLRDWWDKKGLTDMPSFKASTEKYYSHIYCPTTKATLEEQGFAFQDEL